MPIYEYECQNCGVTFEKRQSFNDEPVADCPNGHSDTRRLISTPAIVFKGTGFYINDSRDSSNGNGKSATNTAGKDSTTKSDASTNESSPSTTSSTDSKESKAEKPAPKAKEKTESK